MPVAIAANSPATAKLDDGTRTDKQKPRCHTYGLYHALNSNQKPPAKGGDALKYKSSRSIYCLNCPVSLTMQSDANPLNNLLKPFKSKGPHQVKVVLG